MKLDSATLLTTENVIIEKSTSSDANTTIPTIIDGSLSTTVKLDTSTLLPTENVITEFTEQSILSEVNSTIQTVIDGSLSANVNLDTLKLLTIENITKKSILSDVNTTTQTVIDDSLSTTVKLDAFNLLSTDNVITEKSILSDVNATIQSVTDSSLNTTVKMDTSNLLTTENVITEKPILNDVNAIQTVIDGSLSSTVKPDTLNLLTTEKTILSDVNGTLLAVTEDSLSTIVKLSDNNASNVEINDTSNFNVISVNNNQVNNTQTQGAEFFKLNNEYAYLNNSTSSDFTTTRNEQKGNTENIFNKDFGPTSQNITETVIINASTEDPIKVSSTQNEYSSAVTEQVVTPASTLDNSVLLDTGITLEPTKDVQQIKETHTVSDIAKNESGSSNDVHVGKVPMNSSLFDTTSHVPDKTVNTEPTVTKTFQEVTVDATITDNFPTLSDITIPLESTQNVNKVNTSQSSSDAINHITDNFSDVSIAQETTTGLTVIDQLDTYATESFILNTTQNTPGNETSPTNTISETTRNTVPVLIHEYFEASVNATETTTFINTAASVNTSPDVTSAVTEQTVSNEQVSTSNFNIFSVVPDAVSTVEKPHVLDIISASKSVNGIIDIGPTGFFETNESRNTTSTTSIVVTIDEFNTSTTNMPAENNLENVTPAASSVLATTMTNIASATDSTNYQELYQTITPANTLSLLATESVILTEPTKGDNKVINVSVNDNLPILDIMLTETVVTTDNSSVSLLDKQAQTTTDGSSTPTSQLNLTDRTLIDSLPTINEYTDKEISTDHYYKGTVPETEITTLSQFIVMDQNKNWSSEIINTLQETSSISMNTPISLSSTNMVITEAAYVSSDFNYVERTSSHDETTIKSTTDQTEKQTEPAVLFAQSTDSNKVSIKNIDEFAIKSDTRHAFSDMPKSTHSAVESITPSIIEIFTMGNMFESTSTTNKNNGYLSNSNDALINMLSTTITLNEAHIDETLSVQNIKTGDIVTEPSNILFNIDSNKHLDESSKPFSMTGNLLEKIKNSMKNNSPNLANPPTKGHEPILATENTKSDSAQSSTTENDVPKASSENSIRITTDIPAIENSSNSILKEKAIRNDRLTADTTTTNISENLTSNLSNISSIIQNTVMFDTYTQRDRNTSLTRQANDEEVISAATTEIPMIMNADSYQDSTIKDSGNVATDTYVNVNKLIHQTNPLENITLNTPTSVASNQEHIGSINQTDLHQTVIAIGISNDRISTSADSLTLNKNIRTNATNSKTDSSDTPTVEIKLKGKDNSVSTTLNLNEEDNQPLMDYSRAPITILRPGLVKSTTTPMQISTLPLSDNINAQNSNSLLTQTDSNFVPVNPNIVSQSLTEPIGKDVLDMAEVTSTPVNYIIVDTKNTDIVSSATNKSLSVTLPKTVNTNSTVIKPTKPTPTSKTFPIEFDTLYKPRSTTVSGIDLTQPESTVNSITNKQVSQISSSHIAGSVTSTTYASLDITRQVPSKIAENTDQIPNIEPTIGPVKRFLDNSQVFKDDKKIKKDDEAPKVATFITGQSTETTKKEANTNIDSIKSNTEIVTRASTIQITVLGVQNIKNIEENDQFGLLVTTSDFGVPTEAITTSDVLVDSNIETEKTHSGIISFITPPPKRTKEPSKKENTETKEPEVEEQPKHPLNVELTSLQDKGLSIAPTDIPVAPQIENGNKVQKDISNREELLIKNESNDFKTTNGTKTEQRFGVKNNPTENIPNGTNTTTSGYKKETPTHELIENSVPPINDSHTSNNKSQDQNMSIPQAHNKTVISNDQSSTSRYTPLPKSTAGADTQTTGFPALKSTSQKTESNFSCKQKKRGRYADELDCRKFYICPGNKSSHIIEGTCPVNTAFSEINKQCTKNLSHCIRNNQFRCVIEGRFSDFLNDNIYYICVKNNLSHFIRFKLQCQNGYLLNKTSVRCVLNNESTSTSESKSASEQSSSAIKQDTTEKPEKFNCKKEGVFPDPSNCEKYFECTKVGSSYRQKRKKCDSDENFHKDKKKCVDADSYEC